MLCRNSLRQLLGSAYEKIEGSKWKSEKSTMDKPVLPCKPGKPGKSADENIHQRG
jgi:hypothetical protein